MSLLYLGLVHYPVLNKNGEIIQTSVTNLDIHDIARSAATFGVHNYFIITPDVSQQDFIRKVIKFWQSEAGQTYNAQRSRALSIIQITDSIEASKKQITTQEAMSPIVITTTARLMKQQIGLEDLVKLHNADRPVLILMGTGYGLTENVHSDADFVLQPISGAGDYNHLSVRSAAAIILEHITSAVYKGRY
ncbi:MAG: RNA methyltransferase [Candidatus Cloacimonadaceae bacterium]